MSEVVTHLRSLRRSCAQGMAWSSALVWAEKVVLLTDDTNDVLWLVDALVTNGQYRQAEEWLSNRRYARRIRDTASGQYLASVVALRLGRAEDALDLLGIAATSADQTAGLSSASAGTHSAKFPAAQGDTPTASRIARPVSSLISSLYDSAADSNSTTAPAYSISDNSHTPESDYPLNPRAWVLYMQGAAVIQLSNVGGTEDLHSIKELSARYQGSTGGRSIMRPRAGHRSTGENSGLDTASQAGNHGGAQGERFGSLTTLVRRLWTEAVKADARCWEAWSGLREHGLLTCEEELSLVASLGWASYCGGSEAVGRFFEQYCLATMTTYAANERTVEATGTLLSTYPSLAHDPSLQTIHAARLLSLGHARECLAYTVRVLEFRRIPDSSTTAIHITALTVLRARDALFRIAHELAEEFGISSIKRIEIEPADTSNSLFAGGGAATVGSNSSVLSTPRSASSVSNIRQSIGASVSGINRVRSGARGLLIPESPSYPKAGGMRSLPATAGGSANSQRVGGSIQSAAQSASDAATAAWRGLWGLPTWTRPGPPVLATYPCALGPSHVTPVNADTVVSTMDTLTTSSAQSIGSPVQDEFIGASLAWFAIGCYYLVSASILTAPYSGQADLPHTGASFGGILTAASRVGTAGLNGNSGIALHCGQPLTPEAEHALSEARRWLTKATLVSPRSISAWTAFAHTFVLAGEWESATRALHTAVGLCGFEGVVHGGGHDSGLISKSSYETPSRPATSSAARALQIPERGSRIAHAPLASLGSVYLQMGDLIMAESCLDASMRCLSGFCVDHWLSQWSTLLQPVPDEQILTWCENNNHEKSESRRSVLLSSAMSDPQLLNDIGVLHYARGKFSAAKIFFAMSLMALHTSTRQQHMLQAAFALSPNRTSRRSRATDTQAANSLLLANLGNTLRCMGRLDAALLCLEESAKYAPSNLDITLSTAFALHTRAISKFDIGDSDSANCDLDRAIESCHIVLSSRPGDPVTTDLLSLALELSTNLQGTFLLSELLDFDKERQIYAAPCPRNPDELRGQQDETCQSSNAGSSQQAPMHSSHSSVTDSDQYPSSYPPSSLRNSLEPEAVLDSNEEMEIEGDSDSDMAID